MHDQLSQRAVEGAVSKRKPFGDTALYVDVREAGHDCRDERGGQINRRNSAAAQPLHQLRGQRAWPAADVQHSLPSPHISQLRELQSKRPGKTTHEPNVGIRADIKFHHARVCGHASTDTKARIWSPPGSGPVHRPADAVYSLTVATVDDVRRIALGLPQTAERESRGDLEWRVADKGFVWERPLRKGDIEALGDRVPDGPVYGARTADEGVKHALIADDPAVYFTTPHFNGYAAILFELDRISVADLTELITDAWLARAPTKLARAYLQQ
jgi:hypothetical protein